MSTFDNWMNEKKIEKNIREYAFEKKIKKRGFKFNPGLLLISLRTTES